MIRLVLPLMAGLNLMVFGLDCAGPVRGLVAPMGLLLFVFSLLGLARIARLELGSDELRIAGAPFGYDEVRIHRRFAGFVMLNVRGITVLAFAPAEPWDSRLVRTVR